MAEVTKRGDTYYIRVSNKSKANRKRDRKNFKWKPRPGMTEKQEQAELKRQVFKFEEMVQTGRVLEGNIKFQAFTDKWLDLHAEKQLQPKTVFEYKRQLVRINDAIGHIRLDQLQPAQILAFYNNLAEEGIRADKRYKATDKLKATVEDKKLNAAKIARKAELGDSTVLNVLKDRPVAQKSMEAVTVAINALLGPESKLKQIELFEAIPGKTKLSGTTVRAHHRLISSILASAVAWQVIPYNPADRVQSPKGDTEEAVFLDDEQAKQLIAALKGEPLQFRAMVITLIYTGLRRGELCGLKWTDIDFARKLLSVRRALQYLPKMGVFEKDPKQTSKRPIKMPALAARILLEHKNAQVIDAEACGDAWQELGLVFTNPLGGYIDPDDFSAAFREFITRKAVPLGLPKVTVHSMRHTSATLQIAGGVDIRTVSKRMGHAQVSTTMDIYAHAIRSADEAAADVLDDMLDPMKKDEKANKKTKKATTKKIKIS